MVQKDLSFADVKLKKLKEDGNRSFCLVGNLTTEVAGINQLLRLRNQLHAAEGKKERDKLVPGAGGPTIGRNVPSSLTKRLLTVRTEKPV